MDNIFTNFRHSFQQGTIFTKLIYINVIVFVLIRLWGVSLMLFNVDVQEISLLSYLEMPSSPTSFLYKPWTLITYMFTHFDFLHILFNMLWLYWFGSIFLQFFPPPPVGRALPAWRNSWGTVVYDNLQCIPRFSGLLP
jgi:membrane associated rhomboid family serine protease